MIFYKRDLKVPSLSFILLILGWNYFKNRKKESAILLSLGENKFMLILQISLEIILIATLPLIISFYCGNILGNNLSSTIIQQGYANEYKNVSEEEQFQVAQNVLTAEELNDLIKETQNYDFTIIYILLGVNIAIIAISNTVYFYRVSLKKLLLE